MNEPSENTLEKEVIPGGLLQKLRQAKWAPGLRRHLAQEVALTPPPGAEFGADGEFGGGDADGDGE